MKESERENWKLDIGNESGRVNNIKIEKWKYETGIFFERLSDNVWKATETMDISKVSWQ